MEEIGNDILFFKRALPGTIVRDMNSLIDDNYDDIFNRDLRYAEFPFEGIRGRMEVYKHLEIMEKFNSFWFAAIENRMLDYYFRWITNKSQIDGYKKHIKTEWKDLFIQVYNDLNTFDLDENIHCDFSGITFVSCIFDSYEGGLLQFPKQNVSLKLETGDIVLFPGSYTHPHGVTKISSGERRVLVGQSMGAPQLHKFGKII